MILGKAIQQPDIFSQLVWRIESPFSSKAVINNTHYVMRVIFPGSAQPAQYNVFQNGIAISGQTFLNEATFKQRLNAGTYGAGQPPGGGVIVIPGTNTGGPAIPVNPRTPAVDPVGPGSDNALSFFQENQLYIYAAAAIIAGALYFKMKKK